MGILLKHILRNVGKSWLSGLLIVLSLALSGAAVYVDLNVSRDTVNASRQILSASYGGYDLQLTPADPAEFTLRPADLPGCEVLCAEMTVGSASDDTVPVIWTSDWQTALDRGMAVLAEGRLPCREGEVLISQQKAARRGIALNDVLHCTVDGADCAFTVCGICSSMGILTDERLMTLEILRYGTAEHPTAVLIDAPDPYEPTLARLREMHPDWSFTELAVGVDDTTDPIRSVLDLMLILSVILGFYVISSVITMMLEARLPVLGTLRSLGASRGKANSLLFAESAIYGLLGGAAGIGVGEAVRLLLIRLYFNAPGARHPIEPLYVLISLGFSAGLQMLITAVTLLRSGRRSIRESMFRTSAVAADYSPLRWVFGGLLLAGGIVLHRANGSYSVPLNFAALVLIIFGAVVWIPVVLSLISRILSPLFLRLRMGISYLALRDLSASRINVSSSILTTTVVALAMVILMCTTSISAFFAAYAENYPYDLFVRGMDLPGSSYVFLDMDPNVSSTVTEYWNFHDVSLNGGAPEHVCVVRAGGWSSGIKVDEDAEASLRTGHVIIDRMYASLIGVRRGDVVTLRSESEVTGSLTLRVDGFCDSSIFNTHRRTVLISEADYDALEGQIPAIIGLNLRAGVDLSEALSEVYLRILASTGEDLNVRSSEAYVASEYGQISRTLTAVSVIPLLAVLLAVLGLANNQIIAFRRRRREYAVLYSVATGKHGLSRLIFAEMTLVFLFGGAAGLALGAGLSFIVRDILYSLICYIEVSFDGLRIVGMLCAAFALLCLSGLLPRRIVNKMQVVEEIQYD